MSGESKKRVLRLGIIAGGKIVEERLIRKRESITIGTGPRNTFIIPIPQLPKSYTLFEFSGQSYQLVFEENMEGRVSHGDQIIDLKAASRAGKMKQRGGLFVLPLPDFSRGKVVIGDVTILFQFVDAPPVMPRTQLPAAARGRRIDWTFAYILLISLIIQGGFGTGLVLYWLQDGQYRADPLRKKRARYTLQEELKVKIQKPEKKKKEEEPDKKSDTVVEAPPKPEKKKVKRRKKAKRSVMRKKRKSGKTDRKALRKKIRRSTAIGALLSAGKGKPSAFDRTMMAARSTDNEEAFNNTGRIRMADGGGGAPFGGANKLGKRSGQLRRGKARSRSIAVAKAKRTRKGPETKIRVRAGRVSGKTGLGRIDAGKVSRIFRRRASAIRTCYERGLKANPNLRGKVKIRFTIATSGRVTRIRVVSNSTGSSTVASCITKKVRRWRFPQPEGGVATFTNSFVLSK